MVIIHAQFKISSRRQVEGWDQSGIHLKVLKPTNTTSYYLISTLFEFGNVLFSQSKFFISLYNYDFLASTLVFRELNFNVILKALLFIFLWFYFNDGSSLIDWVLLVIAKIIHNWMNSILCRILQGLFWWCFAHQR